MTFEELARDVERGLAETYLQAAVEQAGGTLTLKANPLALAHAGRVQLTTEQIAGGKIRLHTTIRPRS